jgi:hypothetical protein
MKKNAKFRRSRQPRVRRSSKGGPSPAGEILSLREDLHEPLIDALRSSVVATAPVAIRSMRT